MFALPRARRCMLLATAAAGLSLVPPITTATAQQTAPTPAVTRVDLPTGRSYPIETTVPITRVSVANPDVADVVVVDERNVVVNGKAAGETDVILWGLNAPRRHYRVLVHSPSDRQQILIAVKFAEVRRDALYNLGVSGLFRDAHTRIGTDVFRTDNPFDPVTGTITLPSTASIGTVLTDFGTDRFLALLQLEETKGTARILAEPNIMAANKEDAAFLAGGELPIPVVQSGGGTGNNQAVTIVYREFGIRLNFNGEIVSDDLIKLKIRPEVSSLDYTNAILLQGFRIPALRTRRVESTIDVRRDQSLVISGLMDDEREKVRTGIPLLMDLPIIGPLFGSTRWQRNETELVVIVTPIMVDPMHPRSQDVLHFVPDSTLPAKEALQPRLPGAPTSVPPARRP
ncbi:MAG TPA: pilus assembly protein N-terminal domain-containing protein [Gemmatimonadaceae bacterium]|nr:pilus assembly protein N-terminal domain-containing protein [Gemmatimonadaceae bacterium]